VRCAGFRGISSCTYPPAPMTSISHSM
jgi:hypothetical protein